MLTRFLNSTTFLRNFKKLGIQRDFHRKCTPTVLVHGGVGGAEERESLSSKKLSVAFAACYGLNVLTHTRCVVLAVQEAVRTLEDETCLSGSQNRTSTSEGPIEMCAGIMYGADLNCGAVTGLQDVENPILEARAEMEAKERKHLVSIGNTNSSSLSGFDLSAFTVLEMRHRGMPIELCYTDGSIPVTLGAIAIDAEGNVAAASSTRGTMSQMSNHGGVRTIFAGQIYADNRSGAVSITGDVDLNGRGNLVSRILAQIQFANLNAQEATAKVLDAWKKRLQSQAGAICIDKLGNVGIHFTSDNMPWAFRRLNELHCGGSQGEYIFVTTDSN